MQCLQLQAVTDRLCARTPQVGVRGVWLVRTCRVDSGKPASPAARSLTCQRATRPYSYTAAAGGGAEDSHDP